MRSLTSVAQSEYAPVYETYVNRVPEGDIVEILSGQIADTVRSVAFIIAGHEIHHRTGLEENYISQPKGGGSGGRTS